MMTLQEALAPLVQHRGDRIVVTTMSAVGAWPALSDHPLDFHYLPSSMGQAVPLGLGLALAQPDRGVIVVSGDGGLLMNLGCLVTLAQHNVPVAVVLIDNGLYEVTGGQEVAGAHRTDYATVARGCGLRDVIHCETAEGWASECPGFLRTASPGFAWLSVQGERGKATPTAPRPMADQIRRLQAALKIQS